MQQASKRSFQSIPGFEVKGRLSMCRVLNYVVLFTPFEQTERVLTIHSDNKGKQRPDEPPFEATSGKLTT